MTADFYQTLGVSRNASPDAIKQAYRKLALQYHPDKNPNNKNAAELFLKIQEAYETLTDSNKKVAYDRNGSVNFYPASSASLNHYFKVSCAKTSVKVNEELEISYSYTGDGRSFVRPSFSDFFLSGKPIVSSKIILIDGVEVKETCLTYSIAPLCKGNLTINRAAIKIHQQPFHTSEVSILVSENNCFFISNQVADGKPYIFKLNFEEVSTGQYIKTTRIQQHDLLIPRSKKAQQYQTFGEVLKYLFTVWIIIVSIKTGYGFVLGFIAGSIIGFINAELFYKLSGMKSKVFDINQYHILQKYIGQDYYFKNRLYNRQAFSKAVYFIESIFI